MKINDILREAISKLKEYNIDEPVLSSRRILEYTLGKTKEYLIINSNKELTIQEQVKFNKYIQRLIEGEPLQYIIGKQEFMGMEFVVNKNVLIPQPDTEILVENVLKLIEKMDLPKVLDLCTGSGAIAISIARYARSAEITATDISSKALETAKQNDSEGKIKFILSDLFENINEKFDIIVSNPPYIKTEEIKTLSKQVQNEPKLALDGGQDGLYFYRKIINEAHNYINKDGYICLEIGEDQKKEVTEIIQENKNFGDIKTYKDLGNNDRVIIAKKII